MLAVSLVSDALGAPPLVPGSGAWFTVHAFPGRGGCLLVRDWQRLRFGDSLTVFAPRAPARVRRVEVLLDPLDAKQIFDSRGFESVHRDRELWKNLGCYWALGQPVPPIATRLAALGESDTPDQDLLALEALPPRALRIGAESTPLTASELRAVEQRFRSQLSRGFAQGKVLRAGRRFRATHGGELLEVFLGKPFESPADSGPPIDSIRISRLFVRGNRLIAIDSLFRASGAKEHGVVEPPRLDETNWYQTPDQTLGFLSFDGGHSWFRLGLDVGLEGFHWNIWRLGQHSPTWDFYIDVPH
jgi:hypothetical protein